MHQYFSQILLKTKGIGLQDITGDINNEVTLSKIGKGIIVLTIMHTSASLIIQENSSLDAQSDILAFFNKLVPMGSNLYKHHFEGRDDMPAHLKSILTSTNLSLSIIDSKLKLGTWQGIFLFEHREQPHERQVTVHCFGEK